MRFLLCFFGMHYSAIHPKPMELCGITGKTWKVEISLACPREDTIAWVLARHIVTQHKPFGLS